MTTGRQYLSVAYSEQLDTAGIKPSTGAVGSSYDNALAESIIGLYKTELDQAAAAVEGLRRPRDRHRRMGRLVQPPPPHEYCDDLTPVEAEHAHYAHHQTPATAGVSN